MCVYDWKMQGSVLCFLWGFHLVKDLREHWRW